jgi:hypothetical protein
MPRFLTTDTVTNLKDGFFSMNGVIITVINPFGWHKNNYKLDTNTW